MDVLITFHSQLFFIPQKYPNNQMRQITRFWFWFCFGFKQKLVGGEGLTTDLQLLANSPCVLLYDTVWGITHTPYAHKLAWEENVGPAKVSIFLSTSFQARLLSPRSTHEQRVYGKKARRKWTRSFCWCLVPGFYFLVIAQSQHDRDKLSLCEDKERTLSSPHTVFPFH